jgi:hypothetical protein
LDPKGRKWEEDGENSVLRGTMMFSSPGVLTIVKSRRMRLAGLVACIEKKIYA